MTLWRTCRFGSALISALALLAAFLPPGASGQPMRVGFQDPDFTSSDPLVRSTWIGNAARAGASLVRIGVSWAGVSPKTPPAGFRPSDPSSPGYEWTRIDDGVRSAATQGLGVMFTVAGAPSWAESGSRPAEARPGTWKPNPTAFRSFAHALAERYSGHFPDPLQPGSPLPRVGYLEVWNEPNQDYYLSPQWEGSQPTGPAMYRNLVNHFYAGAKAADPSVKVLAGSMSPFGDPPGGPRTPPVTFLREMLCLGKRLRPVGCPHPAHLDILSDHPINLGAPWFPAFSPLDVSVADVWQLRKILLRAERAHRVLPKARRPIWATEFWYDSNPPDPNGIPIATQARWYQLVLYLLWRQGVSAGFESPLRDSPPVPNYASTQQSGAYFVDGEPKPSQRAFRFPFLAHRTGSGKAVVWGIAPHRGKVRIQVGERGGWRTLRSLRTDGRPRPFEATLNLQQGNLRAQIGKETSLVWVLHSAS